MKAVYKIIYVVKKRMLINIRNALSIQFLISSCLDSARVLVQLIVAGSTKSYLQSVRRIIIIIIPTYQSHVSENATLTYISMDRPQKKKRNILLHSQE